MKNEGGTVRLSIIMRCTLMLSCADQAGCTPLATACPLCVHHASASQTFSRFVEIGRICVVNFGPDAGKLCTIIDLADGTKV